MDPVSKVPGTLRQLYGHHFQSSQALQNFVMDVSSQHSCEAGKCYYLHFTGGELGHKETKGISLLQLGESLPAPGETDLRLLEPSWHAKEAV